MTWDIRTRLTHRVEKTITRFHMFDPGDRVVVACSGGADSTCLLHVLTAAFPALALQCTAVYIDHGLRSGTDRERAHVEELAQRLGAGFSWAAVDVKGRVQEEGESKQEAARHLRYEALREIANEIGAACVAVGHTKTDQAETVLLQLLRGAGAKGLSGIAPSGDGIVRPLFDVERAETEGYCRACGLEYVDDPTNQSHAYLRNRVRLELIPLLKTYNSGIEAHLARLADILRAEDVYLEGKVQTLANELLERAPASAGEGWAIDAAQLRALPAALGRRLIRHVYALLRGNAKGLSYHHVEAVLAAAGDEAGTAEYTLPAGIDIVREYGRLLFLVSRDQLKETLFAEHPVSVPGETAVDWASMTLTARCEAAGSGPASDAADGRTFEAVLDWDRLEAPLVVRNRRPGDRLRPLGMNGRKKLKDIFIDAKVPPRLRRLVPVVVDAQGIVWVVGHCISERAKVTGATRRALRLTARAIVGGAV